MIWLILLLNNSTEFKKAPSFETFDLEGEKIILDSLKGRNLIILDFWSVACIPCVRQLEKAKELVDKYENRLWYVAINEDPPMFQNRAKNFAKAKEFKFTIVLDKDGTIMQDYGVTSLPTTFILNDSIQVIEVHQGFKVGDEVWFEETIEKYLGEGEE